MVVSLAVYRTGYLLLLHEQSTVFYAISIFVKYAEQGFIILRGTVCRLECEQDGWAGGTAQADIAVGNYGFGGVRNDYVTTD